MTSLDGYSGHNVVNAIRYLERVCASAGVDPAHVVQGFSAFYEREGGMRDWKDPVVMLRRTCHIEIEKLLHPQLRFQTQSAKDYTDIPLREVKRV